MDEEIAIDALEMYVILLSLTSSEMQITTAPGGEETSFSSNCILFFFAEYVLSSRFAVVKTASSEECDALA
jgi:hypothetical protein